MKRYLALVIIFLTFFSCSTRLDRDTAALVNNEKISIDDLAYSVHFFPQWAPNKKGRELVDAHLNLLIDKKLFAQEGRRRGFDRTPLVKQVSDWAEKDQMVLALYRDEIRNKVQISEDQIKEAYFKGREQVRLRHLFARSEQDALRLKAQLDAGVPFETLAAQTFKDSTLQHNGGDLGFVGYSDIDEKLAEVAFELPKGVVSPPVRSRWGYHLLRVDEKRQQVFYTPGEYQNQHESIAADVRKQEEKKAAGVFVAGLMAPQDVKMMNKAFDQLCLEVKGMILGAERLLPNYQPMLGSAELQQMERRLSPIGAQTLVTFRGGKWTIQDFVDRLAQLPISDRPRLDSPAHLRHDIGVMIMREFLAREATQRGLDRDPGVRDAVQRWQDEYTFSSLWASLTDTLSMSETEKQNFYHAHSSRFTREEVVNGHYQSRPETYAEAAEGAAAGVRQEKSDQLYHKMLDDLRRHARIVINEAAVAELAAGLAKGERIEMMNVPR